MKYVFISLSVLLAVGCQKETSVNDLMETSKENNVERGLMDEINFVLDNPTQLRFSGPVNPNNPFDHVGEYQRTILLALNDVQSGPGAARNREEYMEQLNDLLVQNPMPALSDAGAPDPIEKEVYNEALGIFTGQMQVEQKVAALLAMENAVRASNAIDLNSKGRMLSLISSFKYVAYTVGNEGILFDGNLLLPGAWWDCWDQQFSYHVGQNMSNALWGWDSNPVATALSWIGLGPTIIVSVADGAIQASNDC
jgi:hypothetical protein